MPIEGSAGFWSVLRPTAWPEAPEAMSFSTLLEMEACPRRWALRAADYPALSGKRGYPPALQQAAVEGTVVHLSLQKVSTALVECGCPSLADQRAVQTLRELGGYTAVVLRSLEEALQPLEGNPRAGPVLERIRQQLAGRVPRLRGRVQRHLARIHPEARTPTATGVASGPRATPRRKMTHGSYAEVGLRADQLRWHGIADLVTVSRTLCEIRDFKMGDSLAKHRLQLRIYALLWARDRDLNPDGRTANRLVLSYEEGEEEVAAPNVEELRHLEKDLRGRTKAALSDVQMERPEARPSPENCEYCPVRQLCEDYWEWCSQGFPRGESLEWTDVQIRLLGQHGPSSWDGIVESGPGLRIGGVILLRLRDLPFELHPGQRVRLLNVRLTMAGEEPIEEEGPDSVVVATMSYNSEAFLVA